MYIDNRDNGRGRNTAFRLAAGTLGRMPGRFGIAHLLGPAYALRCVLFHDISAAESPFTKGMGVSVTPGDFEAALKFLTRNYTPVSLEDVLGASNGRKLPRRPVLVTFDDGYASIAEWAAPLCRKYGVPSIFFLNASVLDNEGLSPDNLVCYAANVLGMEAINTAVRAVRGDGFPKLESLADVFSVFFTSISLPERKVFLDTLIRLGDIDAQQLARRWGLYLTRKQVRELAAAGFEIGNHTYSHVRCRALRPADFALEIEKNRAELEAISGKKVRAFSLPYGSREDLSSDLLRNLRLSGHAAVFLSGSVANIEGDNRVFLDRVSIQANKDEAFFLEIEVLPRLRAIRNRLLRGPGRDDPSSPFPQPLGKVAQGSRGRNA